MITASNDLKTVLYTNPSIKIESGCYVEYKLNDMVNSIAVTNTPSYAKTSFTKLFPASSVVEPNRPEKCGIKFAVLGDISSNEYRNPKTVKHDKDFRIYMPGVDSSYKYYLSNKNAALQLNALYSKNIMTNKIVVKFELSHSTPTSGSVVLKSGASTVATINFTSSDIKAFGQLDAGCLTAYYTGSAWSFTESNLNMSSSVSITEVVLSVSAVSNKYVGVIDISPRLILDISSDIETFNIQMDASSDIEGIVPVGNITANALSIRLNKYDTSVLKIIDYDKSTTTFQSDRLYMFKNTILKPFFKVYHANGLLGSSPNKYDIINQGIFYINDWNISEFGNTDITALDGAKILQDTFCPPILCEQYSLSGIIRYLLDSIGFTNYEFKFNSSDLLEDGIITPQYWWTNNTDTVWQALQQLCIDSQMIALFDNNNVLQFYSRSYIYNSSRTEDWIFYSDKDQDTGRLANISSLDKKVLRSGNKIRVIWNGISNSQYESNAKFLWQAPTTILSTAAVTQTILSTDGPGSYMSLSINLENDVEIQNWLYSFSGYLLIDSEIIEYDAIKFKYKDRVSGNWIEQDIQDSIDFLKFRSYSSSEPSSFVSTGKYRIKTRGKFGTTVVEHKYDPKTIVAGWTSKTVSWL